MTKPLITLPCTARQLEDALHAYCDHHGEWEGTVKVYMEFQNPDAEKYCEGKMYLVLCDKADNAKGEAK